MSNESTPGNERSDALMRAVRRLPQEIEPRRDLWPDIESGIDQALQPKRKAPRFAYAMAAAVACMALGSLITLAVMNRAGIMTPARTSVAATSPAPTDFKRARFGTYAALGPEYERARADLAINLAERLDRLPPRDRELIQRNLADIRRSLREINMALAIDPDSTLLQELLLSTYHSELAVLRNVNQMAGSIPARTDT
jgi:hypothetical protein